MQKVQDLLAEGQEIRITPLSGWVAITTWPSICAPWRVLARQLLLATILAITTATTKNDEKTAMPTA